MDTNEIIKILGITTGPQLLIFGIVIFWGKKLVEYSFSKTIEIKKKELELDLENHKQKLEEANKKVQLDLDRNLESYKNQLEILKLEFQIKYSDLHNKRSEIISNIYKSLFELNESLLVLTRILKPVTNDKDEDLKNYEKAINDYNNFITNYYPNKIYFQENITTKLDKIKAFAFDKLWDFNFLTGQIKFHDLDFNSKLRYSNDLREISQSVRKEIPEILKELEIEFQKILGIIKDETNSE